MPATDAIERHEFDAAGHAQGPQSGDKLLDSGGSLPFLLAAGVPAGRMDSEGFSAGYAQFFGTAAQPHLVARTRAQVVGLVNPGWLVEIEAIAASS